MKFGDRLRILRKNKKLSQEKLGSVFGLAESTISMYERNNREPDYATLVKFAEFFNVSIDYLLTGKYYSHKAEQLLKSGQATTAASDGDTDIEKRIERIERALRLQEGRKPGDTQKNFDGD
ncbi:MULTISPECIES: helix-turn-helix domain-containing protein [Bacillus]|uniref:helix-turn-helix domain-containing protein n=1 Tax=Bacillus TaxID=1386 RepID=UPI0011A79D6C|nr:MULTISPECIES: helix-turn-helix transcriptional regulator [Bacillus]MBU8728352.1 helix-turn-helix domain-containing protein [Bacillus pumilus]MCP1149884.1 helix-turn-helix domain-containing protein [Bacillus sp. 1735sda2]QHQ75095.1 helix-turn-helix domain-containing protein [Bacillus pumilus]